MTTTNGGDAVIVAVDPHGAGRAGAANDGAHYEPARGAMTIGGLFTVPVRDSS